MKSETLHSIPVMTCAEAKSFEKNFFATATTTEESVMLAAGTAVGDAVMRKCPEGMLSHVLVLSGKGHNGGDAVCAASRIFSRMPCRIVLAFFANDVSALAPLTRKFLDHFLAVVPEGKRVVVFLSESTRDLPLEIANFVSSTHVVIDGIFGHSFRPPFPPNARELLLEIAQVRSRDSLWCSVDLPSGLCDSGGAECPVCADFTFPTGILKTPVLDNPRIAGRVVPLGIGFPIAGQRTIAVADEKGLLSRSFRARPVVCDKRDFGHVLILGGSRSMPGAVLLNAFAALRAGAGLVSVICPERVQAAFVARAPGAMWTPCRENEEGGLDCDSALIEFRRLLPRATAVLFGSGMGGSENTRTLMRTIIGETPKTIPLVLDADALRPENLVPLRERGALAENTILTPHAGEFSRLGGNALCPDTFCREHSVSLILKGVCTRVVNSGCECLTFSGTPALARGGSGDVLAGMLAATLASEKNFLPETSRRDRLISVVVWHGLAAQALAREQSERCADISALPDFLGEVLPR